MGKCISPESLSRDLGERLRLPSKSGMVRKEKGQSFWYCSHILTCLENFGVLVGLN